MFNKAIFCVIFFLANSFILLKSETREIRVINFRTYRNLKFVGASQNLVSVANKFQCITSCVSKTSCQGFAYADGSCLQMNRSSVSNLTFNANSQNVRMRRNILLHNLDYDPVTLFMKIEMTLKTKLSIGDMIYLKAILLKHHDVTIDTYDYMGAVNMTYHFRAKCNDAGCNDRVVVNNNRFNGHWNSSNYQAHTYTLQVNDVFEVHILITANGIITYLNGVFQYNLNTVMSALNQNFLYFHGHMKVLEFSL